MRFVTSDKKIFNYFYYRTIKFQKTILDEVVYYTDLKEGIINNFKGSAFNWIKPHVTTIKHDGYSESLFLNEFAGIEKGNIIAFDESKINFGLGSI